MIAEKEPWLYRTIFDDANFPLALLALDEEMAEAARRGGCPRCGGRLDWARYPRKPRGGPWRLGPEHDFRHSFCCAREGCRRRVTPPSVRFLGRRVYFGAVVILATALRQADAGWVVSRLTRVLGIGRRTLERWRRWWRHDIAADARLDEARAELVPPPDFEALPSSLLERFEGEPAARLVHVLKALCRWFGSRFPKEGGGPAEDAR